MSYRIEKTESGQDIIIDGFENGIAASPHKGIANMQGVNIDNENGEVMCSFARVKQSQTGTSGTLTQVDTNTVSISGVTLLVGSWITIINGGTTGLSGSYYYASTGKLSSTYINSPSHTAATTVSAQVLVVGGGASGGNGDTVNSGAGGGGAGGFVYDSSYSLSTGTYTVTVGAGGTTPTGGAAQHHGNNGDNSVFGSHTAIGGGYGGGGAGGETNGNVGGSGGGGCSNGGSVGGAAGTLGQGNAGANANAGAFTGGAGGGSNSSASGTTPGTGTSNSITGAAVTYAAGGAGGANGGGAKVDGAANTGNGGNGNNYTTGAGAGGSGVVIVSYVTGSMTATGGTITTSGGRTIHTFTTSGTFTVTAPTTTVSNYVTGITAGTATFSIIGIGKPLQSAYETYGTDTSGTTQNRYYILDDTGYIWVHDTATLAGMDTPVWFLPDITTTSATSGLAVLNGWLSVTIGQSIEWKTTSILGQAFAGYGANGTVSTTGTHVSYVGHQGKMYTTDGNFITSVFPNSSLLTSGANIQSYCSYTASTTTVTISSLIGGSYPSFGAGSTTRIPVVFFTDGTLPLSITADKIYYIAPLSYSAHTFQVFVASSGGSALDMSFGAIGNQYFNTFYPTNNSGTGDGNTTITFTAQRLNLPFVESATSISEIGNIILVGGRGNVIYPWNQVSTQPTDLLFLPENNTTKIISINNTGYILAGVKGNIYLTNGSSIARGLSVPDYCAGIAGTPSSYIEPYFTWGDIMYLRGRVYFSILDQTATKTGNCGGVWSFLPVQNFSTDQSLMGLRLENQNSYGTYNGLTTVLLPAVNQGVKGAQYWSGWYSSISAPTYGIDFTDTIPQSAIIETDLIKTGTVLKQETFQQLEYKLATPLVSGETVSISYRQNGTDSYVSCGSATVESATSLSGYFPVNFQKGQWLQLKVGLNPLSSSLSSFIRLKELRVR